MVIYFPQESLVVNQAAQGFEQQVLRARIEALRSSRPAGVWFTEGDVNRDADGVQSGYIIYLDGNKDGVFAGQEGGVGGNYNPNASGICQGTAQTNCDQVLFVASFIPDGQPRKVSEGVFSGVSPVAWNCTGKGPANDIGYVFNYNAQGHFSGRNGTVAFGRPKGSRNLDPPVQFVIVDTVGRVRRAEESCL